MQQHDDDLIPDDWKKLPSGLFVKVWTAAELAPGERKLVTDVAHSFMDDFGWRLAVTRMRHRNCGPGKCNASAHDSTLN